MPLEARGGARHHQAPRGPSRPLESPGCARPLQAPRSTEKDDDSNSHDDDDDADDDDDDDAGDDDDQDDDEDNDDDNDHDDVVPDPATQRVDGGVTAIAPRLRRHGLERAAAACGRRCRIKSRRVVYRAPYVYRTRKTPGNVPRNYASAGQKFL